TIERRRTALHVLLLATASACGPGSAGAPVPGEKPPITAPAPAPTSAASGLPELLRAGGLTFDAPPDFAVIDAPPSDRWPHAHALRSSTVDLEIRFGLAPAAVDEALAATCKDDPRCAAA